MSTCTICHHLSLSYLQNHNPPDDSSKENRPLAVPLAWPDLRASAASKSCASCSVLRDVIKRFYPRENFNAIHLTNHHSLTLRIDLIDNQRWPKQEELRLYRLPGTSVPWDGIIEMADVLGSTNSPQSLKWAKEAIRVCSKEHELCRLPQETALPSRVLDIGTAHSEEYIESICLLETNGMHGTYACLSHCWGKKPILTTTTENIEQHKRGIPITDLPKTFLDAVIFAYRLGIRYLWIDSLCIIQNDNEDWRRESANMASIYSNCNVCIAASMSGAGDGGCFRHKPVRTEIFRSADYPRLPGAPEWEIRARHHFSHAALSDATLTAQPNWVPSGCAPLLSRGWVFQERLLSPRFLHFLDQELFIECREMEACECHCQRGRMVGSGPRKVEISKELATGTPDSISNLWRRLVMTYTGLCLTYDTDRLPAFQGLAQHFAQYRLGRYLHGIWSNSLQVDLGWATWNPGGIVFISRPEKQSPPTWSWAAVNAKIMYPPIAWKQTETHCEILSLEASTLVLSGLLVEVTIEYEGRGTFVYLVHSDLERHTSFSNDYGFDCSGPGHIASGARVFCFKLYSELSASTIFTYSLVLRKAGPTADTYERIGLLQQGMELDKVGKTKSIYDGAGGPVVVKLV